MIPQEIRNTVNKAEKEMDESVQYFRTQLSHVRAGKAQTSILDGIKVDYYGSQTPLNQLANVSAPEARLLTVQPYDKSSLEDIEKAIMAGGLGLNPSNDGTMIRIPLPILSEERREELVKHVKDIAEDTRISIRNIRREANDEIKKTIQKESLPEDSKFEAEEEIQDITDKHTNTVDELLDKKKDEIMTV